jgi:hypothetical protein
VTRSWQNIKNFCGSLMGIFVIHAHLDDETTARGVLAHLVRHYRRSGSGQRTFGGRHDAFRAGKYAEAVARRKSACKEHPRGGGPFDYLLLALAHHHLKHADEARACLKEGVRLAELARKGKLDDPTLPMPLFWIQRLELQILRGEAERVINTR